MATPEETADQIDYAAWGERFFTHAVTVERVLAGINVLAGQPIDVGPMGVGPRRVVKVTARGQIGEAVGERCSADPVRFDVRLPVTLEFVIDLGVDKHRFDAEITVPLSITARGLRASIMQHAANVEGELKRFVATYVAREIDKPYVLAVRTIDVSRAIDRAILSLSPRRPEPAAVAADLDTALEAQIRSTEQLFVDPPTSP